MLRKVYIRHREDYPDSVNTFSAYEGFRELGVETVPFFGFGDIDQINDLGPEVGIVGFVGDTLSALKRIGKPLPESMDYPKELRDFLGREVWRSTLKDVRKITHPIFVKPVQEKLFTGFVWRSAIGDSIRLAAIEDEAEVWVSEVVEFESEYRVYVKDDEILGVKHYKGNCFKVPSKDIILRAIESFRKASPRAYSLDVGITPAGDTLVVEVNDAYALGNYGLPSLKYASLIDARWEELTR